MLEVLKADYMRTARAKGLQERVGLMRHGLRTALVGVFLTVVVIVLGVLVPWDVADPKLRV